MLVVMSYWTLKLSYQVYAQTRKESVVIGGFLRVNCSFDGHMYTNLIAMCLEQKINMMTAKKSSYLYTLYPRCKYKQYCMSTSSHFLLKQP